MNNIGNNADYDYLNGGIIAIGKTTVGTDNTMDAIVESAARVRFHLDRFAALLPKSDQGIISTNRTNVTGAMDAAVSPRVSVVTEVGPTTPKNPGVRPVINQANTNG